jgi:hypothetical protein
MNIFCILFLALVTQGGRPETGSTGSISGRVYDRNGEPVAHALVMALQPWYREGQRRMQFVQAVQTNDRGEYRLFWLPRGRYYVSAMPEKLQDRGAVAFVSPPDRAGAFQTLRSISAPSEGLQETYQMTYYGGDTDPARAQSIDLPSGGSITAIDIPIAAGIVRTRTIRGIVINAMTGQPVPGAPVTVTPRTPNPRIHITMSEADGAGRFRIAGAAPGTYHILSIVNTSGRTLSGFALITVGNDDLENVAVVVRPEISISGRVVMDGGANIDPAARVAVAIANDDGVGGGSARTGTSGAGGAFTIRNVGLRDPNPKVIVGGMLPRGGYVKSIRLGAADVLNGKLQLDGESQPEMEIVIAVGTGAIEGRVTDQRQEPAANATVVLVPDAPLRHRYDLYKSAVAGAGGTFRLTDLPPSNYKVFAWQEVPKDAWTDPGFMRIYEGRGRAIHVGESGREAVDIVVIPL